MDLLGLLNIILSMMLLGIIALAGIFILAIIIISIRELIKVFISGPNTKGKK